jgi:hypothetical protein
MYKINYSLTNQTNPNGKFLHCDFGYRWVGGNLAMRQLGHVAIRKLGNKF